MDTRASGNTPATKQWAPGKTETNIVGVRAVRVERKAAKARGDKIGGLGGVHGFEAMHRKEW